MYVTSGERVEKWVCEELGIRHIPTAGTALGWVTDEGELIAGVYFNNYDQQSVVLNVAAKPKRRWLDRRSLWMIFNYVFEQLGCARVTSFVPESNEKAIKLNRQVGLVQEGALERAAPGGERMLIFRMLREECPWLTRKQK